MRTSAAGSRRIAAAPFVAGPFTRFHFSRAGFTLLELLVVVAIMAVAAAGVTASLPDPAQASLEREAQRLAALLESARAQSRASGVPVYWRAGAEGFRFEGLPANALPAGWLAPDTAVAGGAPLRMLLGPEPIIGPQSVALTSLGQAGRVLRVATDGLRPFAVQGPEAP
jgi:general secretion pathway protein H